MVRRLPPLNSLRAFEAVARHHSLSGASHELCVTRSAVGRHVAKLEQFLGTKLFARNRQRLVLTAQGEAYAARLTCFFDQIQEATTENFDAMSDRHTLRIGVYPTFANRVLIPKLAQFKEKFPDIPFQIETSHSPLDPTSPDIDVAVWLGTGDWPDLISERLFHEELLPVGSPTLLCGRTLHAARDLEPFTLLHAAQRPNDWEQWLRCAGIDSVDAHRSMRFDHSGMVYQAALTGLGVAMAQTIHVRDDLEQERLVPFSDLPVQTERSYFVVYAPAKSMQRKVTAFAQWMKSELAPQ
jgi:LysR family transcriptional regulator, glycine cleavage system transcriptional activator